MKCMKCMKCNWEHCLYGENQWAVAHCAEIRSPRGPRIIVATAEEKPYFASIGHWSAELLACLRQPDTPEPNGKNLVAWDSENIWFEWPAWYAEHCRGSPPGFHNNHNGMGKDVSKVCITKSIITVIIMQIINFHHYKQASGDCGYGIQNKIYNIV